MIYNLLLGAGIHY